MNRCCFVMIVALAAGCVNLPNVPIPGHPFVYPSPRPSAAVNPAASCPGQVVALSASRLPPNASIEVWLKGTGAGGYKIPNPPNPRESGATMLGSAVTDAAGQLAFSFEFTLELARQLDSGMGAYELWLVYPSTGLQTPIQPAVAGFSLCSFSIYLSAADGTTARVGDRLRLSARETIGLPITWDVSAYDGNPNGVEVTTDHQAESFGTVQATRPGGVVVAARAGGQRALGLLAFLDPATGSVPVPLPSGLPQQATDIANGARVITDAASWSRFSEELGQSEIEPPIDLSTRSLVAVVLDAPPSTYAPVVTHVADGEHPTVHVVQPRLIGHMVPEPGVVTPGAVTLLSIPRVGATARVELQTISPS